MDIPAKRVYEILLSNGIEEIHHANSVLTACQFLRSKSLMSRGAVERRGFDQTPQASDDLDKRFGVWYDVFADSVDIHRRASRANFYGPVMFVIDSKVLIKSRTGRVWVTKLNPTKWQGKRKKERWFQSEQDLEENFVKGCFDHMLVLRHCGGELPFKRFLKRIVLDDPKLRTDQDVDFFSMAFGALSLAMQDSGLDIPIERRQCREGCGCVENWGEDDDRLFQMFDPKI